MSNFLGLSIESLFKNKNRKEATDPSLSITAALNCLIKKASDSDATIFEPIPVQFLDKKGHVVSGTLKFSFPDQNFTSDFAYGVRIDISSHFGDANVVYQMIKLRENIQGPNRTYWQDQLRHSAAPLPDGWDKTKDTWVVKGVVNVSEKMRNQGIGTELLQRGDTLLQTYFSTMKRDGRLKVDSMIREYEDNTEERKSFSEWTSRRMRDDEVGHLSDSKLFYKAILIK